MWRAGLASASRWRLSIAPTWDGTVNRPWQRPSPSSSRTSSTPARRGTPRPPAPPPRATPPPRARRCRGSACRAASGRGRRAGPSEVEQRGSGSAADVVVARTTGDASTASTITRACSTRSVPSASWRATAACSVRVERDAQPSEPARLGLGLSAAARPTTGGCDGRRSRHPAAGGRPPPTARHSRPVTRLDGRGRRIQQPHHVAVRQCTGRTSTRSPSTASSRPSSASTTGDEPAPRHGPAHSCSPLARHSQDQTSPRHRGASTTSGAAYVMRCVQPVIGYPKGPSALARICSRTYPDPPTVPSRDALQQHSRRRPDLEPGAVGDPPRLRRAGQDHGRVGHQPDPVPVRVRRRHDVAGGGPRDVPRGGGPRLPGRSRLVREKFTARDHLHRLSSQTFVPGDSVSSLPTGLHWPRVMFLYFRNSADDRAASG